MGVHSPIHIVQVFDEVGMRFKGADVLVSGRRLLGANVVAESEPVDADLARCAL